MVILHFTYSISMPINLISVQLFSGREFILFLLEVLSFLNCIKGGRPLISLDILLYLECYSCIMVKVAGLGLSTNCKTFF